MPSEEMTTAPTLVRDIEVGTHDGLMLRGRWWRRPAPRGAIIVSHGYAEHGGCYRRAADLIAARLDVDVIAVDYRGHGRSPGRRGVVRRYDDLVGDLVSVLAWAERQRANVPRFVLAHSNGGQVVLRAVLSGNNSIDGLVVSNPALRIAAPIPPIKLKVGQFLKKFAPWITLNGDLGTGFLTRDPEIQKEHRTDPLRHSRMSPPLFFGMVEGGELLMERAAEIRIPLLMVLGGQDTLIDPAASRAFFDRLGSEDKMLLFYPKMLHEPLNDLGREQVIDDLIRWIERRL
jgi:alpha-beta hydrolase superfamily lysophospholipase